MLDNKEPSSQKGWKSLLLRRCTALTESYVEYWVERDWGMLRAGFKRVVLTTIKMPFIWLFCKAYSCHSRFNIPHRVVLILRFASSHEWRVKYLSDRRRCAWLSDRIRAVYMFGRGHVRPPSKPRCVRLMGLQRDPPYVASILYQKPLQFPPKP